MGLHATLLLALALVYADGYAPLAMLLAVYSLGCLTLYRDPRPQALCLVGERWFFRLEDAGWCPVEILAPVTCRPRLALLRWSGAGRRRHLLVLWPDCGDPDALRRVRRALVLGRGVGAQDSGPDLGPDGQLSGTRTVSRASARVSG